MYAWISPQEAQEVVKAANQSLWIPEESPYHYLDQSGTTGTSQSSHGSPGPGDRQPKNDVTMWPAQMTLSPALVTLIDEITGRGRTVSFLDPGPQLQLLDKSDPDSGSDVQASQLPHNTSISAAPSQETSGSSIYTGKIFQARAEYAASRLVRQVRTLAATGQTSFIHHSQLDDSTILRDAFAACSLYTTRNSANGSLVLSEITRRAEQLIEATETSVALTPPSSYSTINLNFLSAVQAMLIYQCMRLFSNGDITQRTQAEMDAKSLARWVDILHEQIQWSCDDLFSSAQLDTSAWKDWVRAESIQRTVIFAELLDSTYTFLRFGWYQPSARMAKLGFIGQVAIWDAKSLAEWRQAIVEKPWVKLHVASFHDGIKAALPEELDDLGIIILASYDGVEVLEEWAGDDKRLLEKWGLRSGNDFVPLHH